MCVDSSNMDQSCTTFWGGNIKKILRLKAKYYFSEMAQQNVCGFFKYGFCKFKNVCRKRHVSERCQNASCEIGSCSLRHPKTCRYYRDIGYCKFGEYCCFNHDSSDDKVKSIAEKCKKVEEKCDKLEKDLEENKNLGKEIDVKIETFENKISTLIQCIEEKDKSIAELTKRLSDLEKKVESEQDLNKANIKKFSCPNCNYESKSEQGLKIHISRKHNVKNVVDSKSCELCDKKFENINDLKKHMKGHSYQTAKFKCVNCEFVGTNDYTMEVHNGKDHSDNFESGLCEYAAENEESLELHLFTCEIYHCTATSGKTQCNLKGKNLSEMKKHLEKEHEGNGIMRHVKMCTHNMNEVAVKGYYMEEI